MPCAISTPRSRSIPRWPPAPGSPSSACWPCPRVSPASSSVCRVRAAPVSLIKMDEVTLATFGSWTEAEMCAELLRREGIPSALVPLGPGAGGWGSSVELPHQLRVRPDDAARAHELLARPDDEQPTPESGG